MKAGTHNHLKVKRLKRLLGVPLYQAVGILETLWLLATDCADEGDVGKFSDEEIADYLEWDGEPRALISGLVEAGWIDPHPTHRYVIHDWLTHCPEFIHDRLKKRRAREAKEEHRRRERTYDKNTGDKSGQSGTREGQEGDQPPVVPSMSIPFHSIPFHSGQGNSDQCASGDAGGSDCGSPDREGKGADGGSPQKRFTPPTVSEVAAYCAERGNGIDAQQFFDHYTSNGWRVGRNPMKDWRAAVRTWEKNNHARQTTYGAAPGRVGAGQRYRPS